MKRAILLTWDVEEYDAPADFGAAPFPDGGLIRGAGIWKEWLEISARWRAPGTVFVTARLAEAAPDLLRETRQRGHEIWRNCWPSIMNWTTASARRQLPTAMPGTESSAGFHRCGGTNFGAPTQARSKSAARPGTSQ